MTTNTMDCELFTNSLMAYLEGEVDDATRVAMERHSVTCAECGALLADLRQLRVDSAKLPVLQPSRDLWSGIAARIEAPVVDIGTARETADGLASRVTSQPARLRVMRRWMRGTMIAASLVGAAGLGYLAAGTSGTGTALPSVADVPADTVIQIVMDTVSPALPNVASAPVAENREPRAENAPAPARPTEVQIALATLTADYDREIARLRTLLNQRRNQLDPATVTVIENNLKVIDTAIEDSKKAIVRDPASRFLIESLNQSLQTKVELMRTAALLPSRT